MHSLDPEALEQLVNTMLARLPVFKQSVHLEVQERVLAPPLLSTHPHHFPQRY